jgi:hypothetical protein
LRLITFVLGLALITLPPVASPAQDTTRPSGVTLPIAPGTRVRVTADNLVTPLIANYLELRGDTIILFEEGAGRGIWSVTLDQVRRLEATAGTRRVNRPYVVRGALIGGAVGAVGGVVFAASTSPSDPDKQYSRPLSGLLGAAVGAGIGALIGSRFTAEGWVPVRLPGRMSLAPHRGGAWRLSFAF